MQILTGGLLVLLVVGIVALKAGVAATEARALAEQLPGVWTVVGDPGWSGDTHAWVSASDGWSFTPQTPDAVEFYRWDGAKWEFAQALDKDGLEYLFGADIQLLSATDGWAVAPSVNQHYSTFFHWNGTSWNTAQTITDTDIVSIDMIDANQGWAVGGSTCCGANYYQWDGSSWQKNGYTELHWATSDISMVSASEGWSVGTGIARIDGGSWEKTDSPTENRLNGIEMLGADEGWIVGDGGVILRWQGTSAWSLVASPTDNDLNDIEMITSNDGWAVGDQGIILHWDGTAWSVATSPTTADLREIDMTSATEGWIPYYDSTTSSPGLLQYKLVSPSLSVNHATGSPGSFFTVSGSDFPPDGTAAVSVNAQELGTVSVESDGSLTFVFSTDNADEGLYSVTVSVNPSASTQFIIDASEPSRPQEGTGPVIEVPAGIALTEQLFAPVILR